MINLGEKKMIKSIKRIQRKTNYSNKPKAVDRILYCPQNLIIGNRVRLDIS